MDEIELNRKTYYVCKCRDGQISANLVFLNPSRILSRGFANRDGQNAANLDFSQISKNKSWSFANSVGQNAANLPKLKTHTQI